MLRNALGRTYMTLLKIYLDKLIQDNGELSGVRAQLVTYGACQSGSLVRHQSRLHNSCGGLVQTPRSGYFP